MNRPLGPPPRLALVTPGFSASEDDWCIPALLDLVRALAEDADVTVFALRYPHHRRPYEVYGARVVPLGGADVKGPRRFPLYLRALRAILGHSRARRFDVIHACWAHEPGFLAALAGRLTGTPVVVSLFGGELADLPDIGYGGGRSAVNRFLVRRALAGADRVTAGSEYLRRMAEPHVGADRLRVQLLGVDTGLFRPGPVSPGTVVLDGDPKLLHVASLVPVKDQAGLLRAFSAVASKIAGAKLHVVGDGELRPTLEALAKELGLDGRVRFHGELRRELLPDLYRQADLCVLASRSESLAVVALEAAACGCPTVGTAVGVLPDLGAASRTVPPGDPASLGELVLEVLNDRGALEGMARAGLELTAERTDLAIAAAGWRRIYGEIS